MSLPFLSVETTHTLALRAEGVSTAHTFVGIQMERNRRSPTRRRTELPTHPSKTGAYVQWKSLASIHLPLIEVGAGGPPAWLERLHGLVTRMSPRKPLDPLRLYAEPRSVMPWRWR